VDVISFQKIFGLCALKCHIVEIWRDVTLVDGRTTDGRRNVKIELEFWKQNSQLQTPAKFSCMYIADNALVTSIYKLNKF